MHLWDGCIGLTFNLYFNTVSTVLSFLDLWVDPSGEHRTHFFRFFGDYGIEITSFVSAYPCLLIPPFVYHQFVHSIQLVQNTDFKLGRCIHCGLCGVKCNLLSDYLKQNLQAEINKFLALAFPNCLSLNMSNLSITNRPVLCLAHENINGCHISPNLHVWVKFSLPNPGQQSHAKFPRALVGMALTTFKVIFYWIYVLWNSTDDNLTLV